MSSFKDNIWKYVNQVLDMDEDSGQYSDKGLDSGIKTSRAIKAFKQSKDVGFYVSMFNSFDLDKRDFVRIIIELPVKNNLKSKNIELIIGYIRLFEQIFVYTDYIKLYISDGLIHIDTYRENKFPNGTYKKE